MTSIASSTSAAGAAASSTGTTAGVNALTSLADNFQSFLSLLTTQLQNQDPTSPMDTNQFTTELVQMTSVQQQVSTNSNLTQLIALTQGGQVLQSTALVGKTANVTSPNIALQNGSGELQFSTPAAEPIGIAITDASGRTVRTATLTSAAGANTWKWDGTSDSGASVPDGSYAASVVTPSATGTKATAVPFSVQGTVTGLVKNGTSTSLQLGATSVDISALQSLAN
ncbi:MAG: flagellar hook assembly protein FlgD [Janthinobacterium lividum]